MPRRRKRGRKTTRRRTTTRRTSPLGNLAKKVQGINTRLHSVENEVGLMPKRFVRRKRRKSHRLGTLEDRGHDYWATGE